MANARPAAPPSYQILSSTRGAAGPNQKLSTSIKNLAGSPDLRYTFFVQVQYVLVCRFSYSTAGLALSGVTVQQMKRHAEALVCWVASWARVFDGSELPRGDEQ
jgi:hypothetical protein